ncbi:hypothetical protein H4S08_003923 [Coemansia sp. RSA 1365]|nr:hypothetical protein H4S08_003923 [Coemansia sp. RSA 1365]
MVSHEHLEKCAQLLSRKSTDDEKFAGLLLVPRIVDTQDAESLSYLFEATDPKFIARLLRSKSPQSTHGSASAEAEPEELLQLQIALHIIDVFASHDNIAGDRRMLDHIPQLCELARVGPADVETGAAQVLYKLFVQNTAVGELLNHPDWLLPLLSCTYTGGDRQHLVRLLEYTLPRCSQFIHLHSDDDTHLRGWVSVVTKAASILRLSQNKLKFDYLSILVDTLDPLTTKEAVDINFRYSCWPLVRDISAGCVEILRQKTEATQYSDYALALYAHLGRLWPDFVFSGVAMTAKGEAVEAVEKKEAALALRLMCVEGQAAIDAMMIYPPESSDKLLELDADQVRVKRGWKLTFCADTAAIWLDWTTSWLDSQPTTEDADEEAIYALMGEMQKLASSAVDFLVDWKERVGSMQMLDHASGLVVSTVHFLSQWLATDPNLHKAATPILSMCVDWITNSEEYGGVISRYVMPCITFALDTCGISEEQYKADIKARDLHHHRTLAQDFASPWVGTIELDDLARAVYHIPSDEDVLRKL